LDTDNLATLLASPATSQWISSLLAKLDTGPLAGALNANSGLVSELIANLEVSGVAAAVNENPAFLNGLLPHLSLAGLDLDAVAGLVHKNAGLLQEVLGRLDPAVIAGILTANPGFLVDVVNACGTSFLLNVVNSLAGGALSELLIQATVSIDYPGLTEVAIPSEVRITGAAVGNPQQTLSLPDLQTTLLDLLQSLLAPVLNLIPLPLPGLTGPEQTEPIIPKVVEPVKDLLEGLLGL
jgi:hypothetical protein